MRKHRHYTIRNFKICYLLAMLFTITYFMTRCLICIDPCINVPDRFAIPIFLWDKNLLILVAMSWYMFMERYIHFKFRLVNNPVYLNHKKSIYVRVVIMAIAGSVAFSTAIKFVYYLVMYYQYAGELWWYMGLNMLIFAGWLGVGLYCMRILNGIQKKTEKFNMTNTRSKVVWEILGIMLLVTVTWFFADYIHQGLETFAPIEGYTNKYDKYYVLFLATIFPVDLAGYF